MVYCIISKLNIESYTAQKFNQTQSPRIYLSIESTRNKLNHPEYICRSNLQRPILINRMSKYLKPYTRWLVTGMLLVRNAVRLRLVSSEVEAHVRVC